MARIGIHDDTSLDASLCIVSCGGVSKEGLAAYLAARKLASEQFANVVSLAAVSAEEPRTLSSLRSAEMVVAIDGCDNDCATKTLEKAGIARIRHIRITDLNGSDGEQSTRVRVRKAVEKVKEFALE